MHHWCRTSCSGAIEITLTLPISGLSTCNYFWQIFCEKSSSTNFLRKINQAFQQTDHVVWGSHVIHSPMMRFNPKLSHNYVTPFRDFSVSSMYLFHSSGLVLLWLIISVSTEDIKMFAKARLPSLCPLRFRVFGDGSYRWIQMNFLEG